MNRTVDTVCVAVDVEVMALPVAPPDRVLKLPETAENVGVWGRYAHRMLQA